ncbi:Flavin-dependent oxidoreductase, luciferase family (includes alkanesulfonate monooxygenase SsuD and methylene tetrahydromethanopterin reductase) [Quadrisphaera granulorum]|uniref:Alkanesulfonate monooxygenase SsuD/methylene tetrahydromethanopterin reductase-like flavin-dependent oxidoreductase (Luciferase family) n=1 Tax=Quadrisphaera granulorum TaxID=317664 RepID=A0A316A820_9ACTN|nr:LLM class flavin-dependent oxidoreductase [Quadrisphaera granulorum]PWJ53120.1 alkanesulfonate monooxygenase SsuD/methylene tetrahydromethanopterin reductase-like flavin-dependent oxidoreductase (luciferase family) [Quadrisphaera granulorum]SZE97052.1 Flavin-dependent oxidoreductase, luciferase family (includes alkanesulfonate monooxygenase SsuD and methylene tetrahydromethanopterin reductase) [Quadrisphaera granulorum]
MSTPLAVLDLTPVPSGSTVAQALANSADLAESAERFGYARYWVAEHHLNPGVVGVSPAVVLALVAGRTQRIRLGAAALQTGHRTVLSAVEDFALLDAVHPGRIDLGIGRPGGPPRGPDGSLPAPPPPPTPEQAEGTVVDGLRIPGPFPLGPLLTSPRFAAIPELVPVPAADAPSFGEQVDTILDLLAGTWKSSTGVPLQVHPGTGADLQLWLFGSTGGTTAAVAGERGLRFGANYHVAPQGVLDAARAYRAAFRPADGPHGLAQPHLTVSADVVVAETDQEAAHLAAGYGPWVRSIRTAAGAIPYPSPSEAAELTSPDHWTDDDDDALVRDRLATRFVGSATTVADGLERLRDATGADELLITTTTHDHAARIRSYELLAAEWGDR